MAVWQTMVSTFLSRGGLTRREFFGRVTAAGVAAVGPFDAARARRWALISDTHISADRDKVVRKSNMADNLALVSAQVAAWKPQQVLFAGDIAFAKGLPEDYVAFESLIEPIRALKVPLQYMTGNHDHREHIQVALGARETIGGKLVHTATDGAVRWIFLDTLEKVNGWSGRVGPEQREWLREQLESDSTPTIVCIHHNPQRGLFGLMDARSFVRAVTAQACVKAIVYGHTHIFGIEQVDGIYHINLPPSGYLFDPRRPLGWLGVEVTPDDLTLTLHCVDDAHPQHGHTRRLIWR